MCKYSTVMFNDIIKSETGLRISIPRENKDIFCMVISILYICLGKSFIKIKY